MDVDEEGNEVEKGNITEIALIKWMLLCQSKQRSSFNLQKVREFPFISKNKCSATIVKKKGEYFLYLKGQPDSVIPACSTIYNNDKAETFIPEEKVRVME